MPRSSRHKSHRQKHSSRDLKEHSDSEEEEYLREKKRREDSGIRVSDLAEQKESPSQSQQEKDLRSDYSGSRRRKDRAASVVTDRWNGGEVQRVEDLVPDKGLKVEGFGSDSEKRTKPKTSEDSKSRSSRRRESSSERKDEILVLENEEAKKGSGRVESKRKLDKDSGRKDVNEYKDAKDKDRGVDRDRKVQDARRERSVDVTTGAGTETGRKQGIRAGGSEEYSAKRDVEITESQIQDELRNPELEKELEKRNRRRDGSSDKDKQQEDVRVSEDRRLSSRDDRLKNGKSSDERHKDGKCRDKYREDLDKEQRYRGDKHKDEHSVDRTVDKSDKSSDSRHKKAKLQDSNHDGGPYFDDQAIRNKENRGRKRSSDEFDDHSDLNSHSTKEHRSDFERSSLTSSKIDSVTDKGQSESHQHHSDVAGHSTPSNSILKCSPRSALLVKDQSGHGSRKAESRDTFSEGRYQLNTPSTREVVSAYIDADRVSLPMSKQNQVDHSHPTELLVENAASLQFGKSPKSVHQSSPIQSTEKSPSTSTDRRHLNRTAARRSLEVEETGQRNSGSKDDRDFSTGRGRDWELPVDKHPVDDLWQADTDREAAFGSSSRLPSRSPSLPPPPPFRQGVDSPSVLGSSEEDGRALADRKSNNRFRSSGDSSVGRGQGNSWKGVPNWPSPMANGFIPFQHGTPPGGFHALMQQFPAAPLFGVRPSMELSHPGVPFPLHEADRFSGHARPFGWRAPTDDSCPPHMHGWDGSNGVFGEESHIYGRSDWDQNRHVMGSRGWEMNADMWRGQNGNVNVMPELSSSKNDLNYSAQVPSDEQQAGHASQQSHNDGNQPACFPPGRTEDDETGVTPVKVTAEERPEFVNEKTSEGPKIATDSSDLCCTYLSMLDISVDLTSPELYKKCTGLLKMEGDTIDAAEQLQLEDQLVVGSKSVSHILKESLFPATTETIYERAVDLYKKQRAQMEGKISKLLPDGSKVDKLSPASGEEVIPKDDCSSSKHVLLGSSSNKEDGEGTDGNSKGNLSDNSKEYHSNTISDTVSGPIVSADDSQAFEALMPESVECRVNLSRIHIPTESTH